MGKGWSKIMFDKLIIRKLLNIRLFYSAFEKIIGKKEFSKFFFSDYIGDISNLNVLDLGCGPADVLKFIHGEKLYVGIDNNENYIKSARNRFAERQTCQFYCNDLNSYAESTSQKFDLILMLGVMHHIDDEQLDQCMKSIKRIIAKGGRFVSIDCCYTKKMNPIARLLCMLDRGRYVRNADDFVRLQQKYWTDVNFEIRTDGLILPYSRILFSNKDKDVVDEK